MRLGAAMVMAVLASGPAMASGGISCEADDGNARISTSGGVSRGMGGALFSFDGSLEVNDPEIAEDLRKVEFAREHVAQYWLDGDGLKLKLYREREGDAPHGYVEATILSATSGEDTGSFRIEVYDMTDVTDGEAKTASLSGKISCFAE